MDTWITSIMNELENKPTFKKVISDEGKKSLSVIRYKKSEATYHACPILCTEFEEDEEITVLPCKHCFNSSAIERWLTEEKPECPVCRLELDYKKIDIPHEPEPDPSPTIQDLSIHTFADIEAAWTLVESLNRAANLNRASNLTDIMNIDRLNTHLPTPASIFEYRRARILSEDDDIQQAIIASLNDISFG